MKSIYIKLAEILMEPTWTREVQMDDFEPTWRWLGDSVLCPYTTRKKLL